METYLYVLTPSIFAGYFKEINRFRNLGGTSDNGILSGAFKVSFWSIFNPGNPEYVGCDNGSELQSIGLIMWGLFQIVNITILLNLCIALMNKTIGRLNEDKESVWKLYRADAWLLFLNHRELPVPFNLWSYIYDIFFTYCCTLPKSNRILRIQKETKKRFVLFHYQIVPNYH